MRKIAFISVAVFLILTMFACAPRTNIQPENVQETNTVSDSSCEEILERFGVDMSLGSEYMNVSYSIISSEDGDIGQVQFVRDGVKYCYRAKIADTIDDISGMEYDWENETEGNVAGCSALYKWNEGEQGTVLWCNGSVLFSLSMNENSAEDALMSVAAGLYAPGDLSATAIDVTQRMPYACDLDGDGDKEMLEAAYGPEGMLRIQVLDGDEQLTFNTAIIRGERLWLADINGNGTGEVFITGDQMSDDYVTYCLRMHNGLETVRFGEEELINGSVVGFTDDVVEIESTLYMLGTYKGVRTYRFSEVGNIAPDEGAFWVLQDNEQELKVIKDMPARNNDGGDMIVPAGSSIILTASDGESKVWFECVDADGAEGYLLLNKPEGGFVWQIDGVSEYDYFEDIPYAG